MTHYEVLGISQSAGYNEIKKSYRRLVKQYHPDLNPSSEAKELITRITEAYDVLSDPSKKTSYDWSLLSGITSGVVSSEPYVDEREVRRQEYIRKRRQQEKEYWIRLFKLKVKFYKFQRYFAFIFILVSIIYSIDYGIKPAQGPFELTQIKLNRFGETRGNIGGLHFTANAKLAQEYKQARVDKAYLHFSGIFNIPVGISLDGSNYYHFYETFHIFNNFFSYLLLMFALILLYNKRYSDWLLTLGLLPFFIMMFLFVFTLTATT